MKVYGYHVFLLIGSEKDLNGLGAGYFLIRSGKLE